MLDDIAQKADRRGVEIQERELLIKIRFTSNKTVACPFSME
jgi:hypothetical protein